jgi:hypothetical protein
MLSSACFVMWKTSCSSSTIVPVAPVQGLVSPGLTSSCRSRTVIVSAPAAKAAGGDRE